ILEPGDALAYAGEHGFVADADPEGLAVRHGAAALLQGIPVGGGVGVGRAAFNRPDADDMLRNGDPVVFIGVETSPELLPVMQKAAALVTMRGGASSHAAVVARQLGTPCVVGVGKPIVDNTLRAGEDVRSGDMLTVDGDSGRLYPGDASERVDILTDHERRLRQWAAEADR
ncbi:MAG: hypothetical protein HKO62_10600, partial [Gammaproteobacteria bacterium]|nr:hypothetical protein [Gammaproteobacteria bacterium]